MAKIQDIRNRTPFGNPTRKISQIKYIVRHHSATESGNFDTFMKHWKSKGWITGGYTEIILRDGTVQLCYNPEQVTNGVENYNTPTYNICLVGNGSFTNAQEKAWDERVAYNMDRLNVDVNHVKGHREMPGANTGCPGIDMVDVRARIKGGKPSKPSKPKPYTVDAKYPKLENYGSTVGKVQQMLVDVGYKIKVDKSFGPATDKAVRDFQRKHNLAVDGQAGPQTQSKLKEVTSRPKVTVPNKNLWLTSPQMQGKAVRQLQEALASIYFYPEKGAKNNGVDGFFGKKTEGALKRFQSVNGLKTDGSFGPASRKALKRKV